QRGFVLLLFQPGAVGRGAGSAYFPLRQGVEPGVALGQAAGQSRDGLGREFPSGQIAAFRPAGLEQFAVPDKAFHTASIMKLLALSYSAYRLGPNDSRLSVVRDSLVLASSTMGSGRVSRPLDPLLPRLHLAER